MGWKSVRKGTNGNKALPVPENSLKKDLANLWSRRKSQKSPKTSTLVVGKKPNGKSRFTRTFVAAHAD